jgi:hypothetical protein
LGGLTQNLFDPDGDAGRAPLAHPGRDPVPPMQQQDGAIDLDLFQRAIRSQTTRRTPLPAARYRRGCPALDGVQRGAFSRQFTRALGQG